jgi:hypothetical protein
MGLPRRLTSASWMLAFLMPAEVRRGFIVPFPFAVGCRGESALAGIHLIMDHGDAALG